MLLICLITSGSLSREHLSPKQFELIIYGKSEKIYYVTIQRMQQKKVLKVDFTRLNARTYDPVY